MKARTMRRFWAVLLCLVMVLGLLPAAALADEGPEMETTVLDPLTNAKNCRTPQWFRQNRKYADRKRRHLPSF